MTGPIDRQTISEELRRVLDSRAFARSARSRDLLRYLVDRHIAQDVDRLKEAVIAIDVFKRGAANFDGDRDGIVRVSINRLREHLDRFYKLESEGCQLRFEIPRGSYAPIIRRITPTGLPARPRIAVLPLVNMTGESANDATCDGLTEDLIDALAQVPELRITARTSSFRYKNVAIDVREIARDLDVDALLEGSVQRVGEQIRVTAQLVMGSDGTHLWSQAFEAATDDRHLLQHTLRALVVRSISSDERDQHMRHPPRIDARARYLIEQARMLNMTQLPENMDRAERLAGEATAQAPDSADAWFVLAMVRYSRYALWNAGESQTLAAIEAALNRARDIQYDLPQALSLSAYVVLLRELDWNEALALARQAATGAPSHAGILGRLGAVHLMRSEWPASINAYRECVACDPYAPPAYTGLALALSVAGEHEEAMRVLGHALTRCGDSLYLREAMIVAALHRGDFMSAHTLASEAAARSADGWRFEFRIAQARAGAGDAEHALAIFERVAAAAPTRHVAFLETMVRALCSDANACIDAARRAIRGRTPASLWLMADPLVNRHRSSTRWSEFCRETRYDAIAK
jgi:TolB-like protein/tetratricopeptide (TPR) repeat protein